MLELLFLLLPVAAAYGWYMGRRSAQQNKQDEANRLSRDYVAGVNFLLSNQQDKAVDLFLDMQNMLYEAAWKADNGTITSGDAAMCKYFCANAAFEVVDSAMQVLGGVGIAGNHRISRFWRDLRVDRVSGGSDEMQILTLGRAVLKQYR